MAPVYGTCDVSVSSDCKAERCSEAVLRQLEDLAATDHLLPLWRRIDQHGTQARKDAEPLSTLIREGSVRHMMRLAKLLEVVRSSDAQLCITLFDAFCIRCPGGVPLEEIPVTVAAIIVLVAKVDGAGMQLPCWATKHLATESTTMTQWLGSLGQSKVPITVTEETILVQERKVLRALGWSLHIPTIETWVLLTIDRLDVLSAGKYQKSLDWVRNAFIQRYVQLVMLRQPATSALTSGNIAGGLVCMALFAAQLLPPAILKPPGHTAEDWEQLFKASQPPGCTKPCSLSDDECMKLLDQLAIAIGKDRTALATDCGDTLALVGDAMAEARHRASLQSSHPVCHRV